MAVITQRPSELIQDTFRAWHAERESLDAELSESLAALTAYQSHLDTWQAELARERDEIHALRTQLQQERAALEQDHGKLSGESGVELQAAREKIGTLTASLLNRTEELRTAENRRAELVTELELMRAREKELRAALDEQKRTLEVERNHWSDEIHSLRELLERQLDGAEIDERAAAPPPRPQAPPQARPAASNSTSKGESPVFGSIVEQFGKLRQQRAVDRQALKKPR
jgi:chromosome segregation ATPase